MTKIFELPQIKEVLENINAVEAIEEGFVAYSQGRAVVPPIGELIFDEPPGDVHIKYGYITGEEYYVIKIASGFYENVKLNLPTGAGLMLVFRQRTGELACVLLDEGYLTDVRTAAAGAVVARYLAPKVVRRIGIVGAGVQGKMQLEYLSSVLDCREAIVWGIDRQELDAYLEATAHLGFDIQTTLDAEELASSCNYIMTATPSKTPLLSAGQIRVGTHITAVGADTSEKNELDPGILRRADLVVADSISQCLSRGEIYQAIKAGRLEEGDVVELGDVISDSALRRKSDEQITVADLTGVAVQDIQISKACCEALLGG